VPNVSDWQKLVHELPLASSHTHHRPAEEFLGLDLARLLNASYVGWGGFDAAKREERAEYVDRLATNTYFVWLSRAVAELYGSGEISAENWEAMSEAITAAHADPQHHFRILEEHCRLKFGVQDAHWSLGDDMGRFRENGFPKQRTTRFHYTSMCPDLEIGQASIPETHARTWLARLSRDSALAAGRGCPR
jgi:hypothetical protein